MTGDLLNCISLYFHIPFCTKKCPYCHFYVLLDNASHRARFLTALKNEWRMRLSLIGDKPIGSIYFGGGTPALLSSDEIKDILDMVHSSSNVLNDCEITIEANPENIDRNKLQGFFDAGINRLSIGVQSFDDDMLKTLDRIHDSRKAIWAIETANQIGFNNISIDIMYDLPGQTPQEFSRTLDIAAKLPITHLSLYNLQIEPNTAFYKRQKELNAIIPRDENSTALLQSAIDHLTASGFEHYEISAFARHQKRSFHNLGYWQARPFLGFGPSAFSYWDKKRFRNCANLLKYEKALFNGQDPVDFSEQLETLSAQNELFAVEMRLLQGVNIPQFEKRHGALNSLLKKSIEHLISIDLLKKEHDTLSLTKRGIFFYDSVAVELI
ncbi:MAG: radical SAM family heme chaperone HemW [Parachlamydiales bacterium]|nr:radical SAM family heme chaperone HemW [Parachlamydiales bacterium]